MQIATLQNKARSGKASETDLMQLKSIQAQNEAFWAAQQLRVSPLPSPLQRPGLFTPTAQAKAVIQRNVNTHNWSVTKNLDPHYFVNPQDRKKLYSKTDAQAPKPTALYGRKTDHDDNTNQNVYVYYPNARLLDNYEKSFQIQQNELRYQDQDDQTQTLDLMSLFREVEQPNVQNADHQATVGILGKNDCADFARTLYRMIARENYVPVIGVNATAESMQEYAQEYPGMEIGDMMRHIYPQGLPCKYHGATVVAKDQKLVTLEAHVSKNLNAPDFHIRDGVAGFVTDNRNAGDEHERGTNVEVSKINDAEPDDNHEAMYRSIATDPTVMTVGVGSTKTLAFFDRQAQTLIHDILRHGNSEAYWKTKTLSGNSMPDSISTMRNDVQNNLITAIGRPGNKGLGNKPWNRAQDTHDFYKYVEHYRRFHANPTAIYQLKTIIDNLETIMTKVVNHT